MSGGNGGVVRGVTAWVLRLKVVRAYLRYSEHHGPMLADSMTYRALFSVFAGIFVGFAIAGIWLAGNQDAMDAVVKAIDTAIPGLIGADGLIDPDDLIHPLSLGIAGIIALVGLIMTAIGAIKSTRTALRTISDEPDDRSFFLWVLLRDLLLAISFGVLLGLAAVVTFLSTSALGVVFDWLGVGSKSWLATASSNVAGILVIFVIDTAVVALMFRFLSGLRPSARSLWSGAAIGGVALTVLQELSSLFIGGASSNPLLASFGSIVALLIWFNFSSQAILVAFSYIITGVEEQGDRLRARYGASTMTQRRVRQAENRVVAATDELNAAREAIAEEREKAAEKERAQAEKTAAENGSGGAS